MLSLFLLVVPGTISSTDGQSMLQVTRSIVERHDVVVSVPLYGQTVGVPGLGGRQYSKYGIGQSLLAVPLYLLGRQLGQIVPASFAPELPILAASTLPALTTALATALMVVAALELGASRRGALALALVYALATPAVVYTTQWFSEPLTGCAVLAAFYLLLRERNSPGARPWRQLGAGAALGVAVATRPDALLLAVPLVVYALLTVDAGGDARRRVRGLTALLAPLGLSLLALSIYNNVRFGSPFETGYSYGDAYAQRDRNPPHTLASFAEGLYGLLLSPGQGLLEYAPAVLLAPLGAAALWARRRAETLILPALVTIYLVAHANVLIRWLGGWSWGPRFLLPVLPFMLLLLAPLLRTCHKTNESRGR